MAPVHVRRRAALDAVQAEAARAPGAGYAWGVNDCSTLICALCRALGRPEPAYGPFRGEGEAKAAARALRRYGTLGAAHQVLLVETGGWVAQAGAAQDGDVASVAGRVAGEGVVYVPARPEMHLTGIVAGGRWWTWQPSGLVGMRCGALPAASHVTRAA